MLQEDPPPSYASNPFSRAKKWLKSLPAVRDLVERRAFIRSRYSPYEDRSLARPSIAQVAPVTTFAVDGRTATSGSSAGSPQHGDRDDGQALHQVHTQVTNIERSGNTFTGVNNGQVIQVEEYNALRSVPMHPDISCHLSDYFPEGRSDDEAHVLRWINSTNPAELVLCVLGKVGVGKSTLAKHLATRLRRDGRLAAEIFFGFALPDWSPESSIRMITGQLCRNYPFLKRAVAEAIELDGGPSVSLETRIRSLVLEPIRSLCLGHPLVVVLDALDQWAAHPILIKALGCLNNEIHLIRFIVLGRPELGDRFQHVSVRRYSLSGVSKSVMANYFGVKFKQVQWEYGRQPSSQTINKLVSKADGFFIWSSTLCALLEDELSCPKPHDTLMAILQSQKSIGDNEILANLYHSAINLRFPKPEHKEKLKVFLGAVLVLQEPLPVAAFASLVSMEVAAIRKIQANVSSLHTGQAQDTQDMVFPASSTYHLSVLEYFQSPNTPSHLAFPIDPFTSHSQLGKACLEELRHIPASPQPHFMSPIQKYAMKYWPTHIAHGTPSVSPTSDAEWRATPHCAILDSLSVSQWQHWASTYHQSFRSGMVPDLSNESTLEGSSTSAGNTPQVFISQVLKSLRGTLATTGPSDPTIAMAEVAVRLQHQGSDTWLDLAQVYRNAAEINELSHLIEDALCACRNAVDLDGNQGYQAHQVLAICLWLRFSRLGFREDLDEAISLGRAVLVLTPPGHPDHLVSLHNLATSLDEHHRLTGTVESLDEAIMLYQEVLLLRPPGHPDRAKSLNNLANSLGSHHKLTGAVESLDEAIMLLQEALLLWLPGHPDRTMSLNNLGSFLHSHHNLTGTVESLDEVIVLYREALLLWPPGHPDRARSLNNLANSLESHHKLTGAVESLDEAIVLLREALLLLLPGHPGRAMSLHNLANSLDSHHNLTGTVESLDEAIVLLREALSLWPPGHPDRARSLMNLANSLHSKFMLTGTTGTLDEVIMLRQEILSLYPPGHRYHTWAAHALEKSLDDSRGLKDNI